VRFVLLFFPHIIFVHGNPHSSGCLRKCAFMRVFVYVCVCVQMCVCLSLYLCICVPVRPRILSRLTLLYYLYIIYNLSRYHKLCITLKAQTLYRYTWKWFLIYSKRSCSIKHYKSLSPGALLKPIFYRVYPFTSNPPIVLRHRTTLVKSAC